MAARKSKKALSMQEELALILAEEGRQRQMLTAVVDKAIGGDMKAVEFVRETSLKWRTTGKKRGRFLCTSVDDSDS